MSSERILDNERSEQEAFDAIADRVPDGHLVTSDYTFDRYRAATNQKPLFNSYPDLLFVEMGRRHAANGNHNESKPLAGLEVLDLGSGDGAWSVILAEQGANVSSIEISPKQVELAHVRMKNHDLRWNAKVGSAFRLEDEFEEETFDLVFGPAVLHHLTFDLPAVYDGVHSILKTGGVAVFTEPFMDMKWLRALRLRLTGVFPLNAESPDERPLTREDIQPLEDGFSQLDIVYQDLSEKVLRRFGVSPGVKQMAASFDRARLSIGPFKRLATAVVLTATK